MIESAIQKIQEIGIIPVVRAANADEARRAVDAICAAGIPIIEITMTVPNAPAVIEQLARELRNSVLVGAGTVTTAQQAETCMDAGAQFLVSPGLSVPVVHAAAKRSILAMPGALTPTEVMAALEAGAQVIKIFPCSSAGGAKHIKALRAPFPQVRFVPTGGVNLATASEYLAAGAFALGVGSDLVDLEALRRNNTFKIAEMARALVEAVREARASRF
jgi:2-dehydro-3-deoxyphosphogluconate aldolase / (4S)-4-hydroxy-2-oxoglutarate aldolase